MTDRRMDIKDNFWPIYIVISKTQNGNHMVYHKLYQHQSLCDERYEGEP